MTRQEQTARNLIAGRTTEQLLNDWEATTTTNNDPHIPTVRGWMMDEFEKRNHEAFNAWMDEDAEDETLRDYMTR